MISSAIQILHAEAEQKRVVVSSKQPARKLPVRADKVHLQQVILNLATNAIDAMVDAATTHRELVFQTALMEESKVVLSISDTGRGIPRDQLDSVFNAFYTTKPAGIPDAKDAQYGSSLQGSTTPDCHRIFVSSVRLDHSDSGNLLGGNHRPGSARPHSLSL
ncbi:ATP-binding protein [Sinorhizobium medicae]|uniref:ATP-binding protein n=1 Tax=Sinorhizobium medicae TaxID=110321 RepID=UPI003989D7B7